MKKQIVVVGLGLIGGSLAMSLRGFEDYEIIGMDISRDTLDYAGRHGVADRVTDDNTVIKTADVVFLCLHPDGILKFLRDHRTDFKPGALVTDVCGVKTAVMEQARCLPDSVDFIGCHPMAGKEQSGIRHADATVFRGAHFILTPRPGNTPAHLGLMERMALYMGFRDVVKTTPEEHDAMIAYTSQVMHILAVAVCDDPDLYRCRGFEGGSFRDCTRVAALDVPLWTQLFSLNAPALTAVIERLEGNLRAYREALSRGDAAALAEKLRYSSGRKRALPLEECAGLPCGITREGPYSL